MFFNTKHTTALCFVTCMAFSSSSIADIVISGTRVIYKSDQKSVNVRLENKGNNPLLVQSWLDTGETTLSLAVLQSLLLLRRQYRVLMPNVGKQSN
ncbi:Chaperone protein ecpD precursor [Escherichia coli]|uniref:Chaperone protein ecpD n=1 Tax=Escherichia coli TaxID=562 RepID=A0A2X1NBX6_ECOLX|nr:Chaperone protein ecpD precursor [Escherichia coli]